MTSQEYRAIAFLLSALAALTGYSIYVFGQVQAGGFETDTIPSAWGVAVLIAVGAQIGLSILSAILVTILHVIATKEEDPIEDERDAQIESRADRASFTVVGIGFILAMIALALGRSPLVVLNIIVYAFFASAIVSFIVQLSIYRRGF